MFLIHVSAAGESRDRPAGDCNGPYQRSFTLGRRWRPLEKLQGSSIAARTASFLI
jgi:hypothetical protein